MNLQRIMLSGKKKVPKGYILYDPIYITFLKRKDYSNEEQISSCQGVRRGGEVGRKRVRLSKGNMREAYGDGNVLTEQCQYHRFDIVCTTVLKKYLFIWLCPVLDAACKIFSCGMWDLVP